MHIRIYVSIPYYQLGVLFSSRLSCKTLKFVALEQLKRQLLKMTEKVVAKIAYVFNGMHWALPNPCSSDKNVLNNQQTSTVALSVWVQVTVYERNTTVSTFVKQSSHLFVGKKE